MEDILNPSQDTEETGTSEAGQAEKNNTSSVREDVKTQKTGNGRTAQDRIRELVEENKILKSQQADKQSSSASGGLEERVLKVELASKVPEHLKKDIDGLAAYVQKHGVPVEDAIALFDAKGRVSAEDVAKAKEADDAALNNRMGGTANPAVRQEVKPLKEMQTEDLRSELEQRIARGETV